MSSEVRLNFDLVCKRYDISEQDIIDIAPLLFFITAEKARDEQLKIIKDEIKRLKESEPKPEDISIGDIELKIEAHEKNDIFERYIEGKDEDYDIPHVSPFIKILDMETSSPQLKDKVEFGGDPFTKWAYDWFSLFGEFIPSHLVCKDEFDEITLKSQKAKNALREGVIRISDIPDDLFHPHKDSERVLWMEKQYDQAQKEKQNGNPKEEESK